jgi:hypothetical protein
MTAERAWADDNRPRRPSHVASQRTDGSLVLLDLESGRYYTLEGSGPEVWELCDGEHELRSIVAAVSATHRVDPQIVRADVLELLDHLAAEGLVDVAE